MCDTDSYDYVWLSSSSIPSFPAPFSRRSLLRLMMYATVKTMAQTNATQPATMPMTGPGLSSRGFSASSYRTRSLAVSIIATDGFAPLPDCGGSPFNLKNKRGSGFCSPSKFLCYCAWRGVMGR
jgi:hypothetical protein